MSLRREVENFRCWAERLPAEPRSGTWECNYEDWPALWSAARNLVDSCEYEEIVAEVAKRPQGEPLGRCHDEWAQAESMLLELFDDSDEYTRRRTLLALGALRSKNAEALPRRACTTGNEHQRIAALHVMHQIGSSQLEHYIELALQDGRKLLAFNAVEFRRANKA